MAQTYYIYICQSRVFFCRSQHAELSEELVSSTPKVKCRRRPLLSQVTTVVLVGLVLTFSILDFGSTTVKRISQQKESPKGSTSFTD